MTRRLPAFVGDCRDVAEIIGVIILSWGVACGAFRWLGHWFAGSAEAAAFVAVLFVALCEAGVLIWDKSWKPRRQRSANLKRGLEQERAAEEAKAKAAQVALAARDIRATKLQQADHLRERADVAENTRHRATALREEVNQWVSDAARPLPPELLTKAQEVVGSATKRDFVDRDTRQEHGIDGQFTLPDNADHVCIVLEVVVRAAEAACRDYRLRELARTRDALWCVEGSLRDDELPPTPPHITTWGDIRALADLAVAADKLGRPDLAAIASRAVISIACDGRSRETAADLAAMSSAETPLEGTPDTGALVDALGIRCEELRKSERYNEILDIIAQVLRGETVHDAAWTELDLTLKDRRARSLDADHADDTLSITIAS